MAYTIQDWKNASEGSPTPIWANDADTLGPNLEHMEVGIYDAHVLAAAAQTTADAALVRPAATTDQVVYYNGTAFAAAKITNAMVATAAGIEVSKLANGTTGQVITATAGGVAWQALPQGVPLRTVLMFHMDAGNEAIPSGWAVCNGQTLASANHDIPEFVGQNYTVPDLRNRFVLGADPGKAVGNAGGTSNVNTDGPGPKGAAGGHAKTLTVSELPGHSHAIGFGSGSGGPRWVIDSSTANISQSSSPGYYAETDPVGSGQAWDTRPRFYGLVFIMKVKNV